MRIAITGSSGFVGSAFTKRLIQDGHEVRPILRTATTIQSPAHAISWDPATGVMEPSALENLDVLVHLAGKNIGQTRWTPSIRKEIWDSRIEGTRRLITSLKPLNHPPKTLISASAIGYYGDRGDDILHENSAPGNTFLAHLCAAWEEAAMEAQTLGIRVVTPRLGTVLGPDGGALARLLPLFRLGLGGPVGMGRQWMSWISINDLIELLIFLIKEETLSGPVNAVAPSPITNREFTRILAHTLRRPAFLPVPEWVIKTAFGEMGRELLLTSLRVLPTRLTAHHLPYQHATLSAALSHFFYKKEAFF